MRYWGENHLKKCSEDSYPRFNKVARSPSCLDDGLELRKALLDFIADFANWDNSTSAEYLAVARTLTVAAHDALENANVFVLHEFINADSLNDAIKDAPRPLLVDPFAGGGAIPLEALRCGADAFASDLNPVAVLLNKVVLEYIPKYGQRLADEVEKRGKWIKDQAEKELAEFYPKDEDGATPIAYLWARTITCEGPGCGAEVPLIRSLWLAKKGNNSVAVQIVPKPDKKRCDFVIIKKENGKWVCQDRPDKVWKKPTFDGTVVRGSATCPCCGFTTPVASVRSQLKKRKGGANDARLFSVVTKYPAQSGRIYRLPTDQDLDTFQKIEILFQPSDGAPSYKLSMIPDEPISTNELRRISIPIYGMETWGDVFNSRQGLLLSTIARLGCKAAKKAEASMAEDLIVLFALALGRQADACSTLARWHVTGEKNTGAFGRQALGMVWDYCEINPFSGSTGGWDGVVEWIVKVCRKLADVGCDVNGEVRHAEATAHPLADDSAFAWITDPPYYDSVPYAHLSDYFYVWMRRMLGESLPEMFGSSCVPKEQEIVVDRPHSLSQSKKDIAFYERELAKAFAEGRRILRPDGIGAIVFASKSTASWEAILQAVVDSGWIITGSWPIDTEMATKVAGIGQARLMSSVHLVCRPREDENGMVIERIGDWRDVLSELPGRIAAWLPRLASESVVGADAIFACLGPALEIFSRYSSVEKTSGEVVPLREYLEQVWAEVARQALNMIFEGADASGFEEDARLTAMWLWTLRSGANGNGEDEEKATSLPGYALEYDAARKIAQGLGCHLENLTHLVEVKGDIAMLLSAESRARYLFGKEDVRAPAKRSKKKEGPVQQELFSLLGAPGKGETEAQRAELERPPAGKTVLDQLHQTMLLFAAGRGAALKRFLVDDGIGANPQFWTLAQALSALYPAQTNEKRWVDGVLARKKGLGL